MASKPSRPALDAWLAKADRVLAEVRSGSPFPVGYPSPLGSPLDRAGHGPRRARSAAPSRAESARLWSRPLDLIVEDKDARYAQVLAYEGGSVYAESVSGWRAPERKKVTWTPPSNCARGRNRERSAASTGTHGAITPNRWPAPVAKTVGQRDRCFPDGPEPRGKP